MKIGENIRISINSTAYYLLSYLFVFVIHQIATLLAAAIFQFPANVDYSRILFMVSGYEWSYDSVKIIYSAGPLITIITAIFMAVVAYRFKEYTGTLKLFFTWGLLHCVSLFLGSAYAGALLGQGFGHVLIWMFMGDTTKLLITLVSLFLLATTGIAMTRMFLLSANSYFNLLKTEDRFTFVLSQVVIPFIAGTIIIMAVRYPLNPYEILRTLTPFIVVLTIILGSFGYSVFYFDENPKKIRINGILILITGIIYLVYRVGLHHPIMIEF